MLVSLKEVIKEGKARNIGVANFNTPNLETLLAVLRAAEELDLPLIIAHAQVHESVAPLDKIGRVMVELAKSAKIKVCVHLDHGEDFEYCKRAIDLGFTSIMIDCSTMSFENNIFNTKKVVEYAHSKGVDVEAEFGALPQREGGGETADVIKAEDLYTKPKLVPEFINRTGVDALAIAFGTAHGIYKNKPVLNLDIISQIREVSDIPLVMHGGSGLTDEDYKNAISRGINKINYYTYMSYDGYATVKKYTEENPTGFYHDMALMAEQTMYKHALRILKVFSNK